MEVSVEVDMEEVHHGIEVGRHAMPVMNEDIMLGTVNMDDDLGMDSADRLAVGHMAQGEEGEQFCCYFVL